MNQISSILITFFFIFLTIELILLFKLWFEINKFEKITKFQSDILVLKSQYFLNKLNYIYDLALRNKAYKIIFLTFLKQHKRLFIDELMKIINHFLKNIESEKNSFRSLAETKSQIYVYKEFEKIKQEINDFNLKINYISSWETFCLEQANFFNLLLDKTEEELEKIKLTTKFNFDKVQEKIDFKKKQILHFEKNIFDFNHQKTFDELIKINQTVPNFVINVIFWFKLIVCFQNNLPLVQKNLILEINQVKSLNYEKLINKINEQFKNQILNIRNAIKNFKLKEAEITLLQSIKKWENLQLQIKNRPILQKTFLNHLKMAQLNFEFVKYEFIKFKKFVDLFVESFFFNKQKRIEFREFNLIFKETESALDELIVFEEKIDKSLFIEKPLLKLKTIMKNTIELIINYEKMQLLFAAEQDKNVDLFFSFLNLKIIFAKKENFFLKQIYYKEFEKVLDYFMKLKQKQHNAEKSSNLLISDFSQLKTMVKNLKIGIQNTVLLREIAISLLIKSNKYRFLNDFFKNKILNIEIMLSKNEYKNAIENLLEINEGKFTPWTIII